MTKLHRHIGEMGFSVLVPDAWAHHENLEEVDLLKKERERQRTRSDEWGNLPTSEKDARLMLEISGTLGTALQAVRLIARNAFYNAFMQECAKQPEHVVFRNKTNAAQMRFLLQSAGEVLSSGQGISALQLLLALQRATDEDRLQAKEEMGMQMGYFIAADEDDKSDSPSIAVLRFNMSAPKTASEWYPTYKASLPAWFWSGIPDVVETVRNSTVDSDEMKIVQNYLTHNEIDSVDTFATKGTVGWVISCTAYNFRKYKKLFSKMIASFRVEAGQYQ